MNPIQAKPAPRLSGWRWTLAALLIVGCGDTASQKAEPGVAGRGSSQPDGGSTAPVRPASFDGSPRELLEAVLARYRHAAEYHDRGRVKLTYRSEGSITHREAPLEVWFDRGAFYVNAYDVRIWSEDRGTFAWILDPSTDHFDGQVLWRRSDDNRPDVDDFTDDPILAAKLAAGLAGPPPQLEWLFASTPMRRLFDDSSRLSFLDDAALDDATLDDHTCRRVRIDADGESFVFWVDARRGVIRRVDLPDLLASAEPGEPQQRMRLSLELRDAAFSADGFPAAPDRFPESPRYVRRFVSAPPPEPPATLGQRPRRFVATTVDGGVTVSHRGSDRDVTVLFAIGSLGNAGSLPVATGGKEPEDVVDGQTEPWAIRAAGRWCSQLPAELAPRVRCVLLMNPDGARRNGEDVSIPILVDDQKIAEKLGIAGGGVAVLDPAGRLAWIQPSFGSDAFNGLGSVIADVLKDVDVPKRIRAQWRAAVDLYREELGHATIRRN